MVIIGFPFARKPKQQTNSNNQHELSFASQPGTKGVHTLPIIIPADFAMALKSFFSKNSSSVLKVIGNPEFRPWIPKP
jgi:hypothetical protein